MYSSRFLLWIRFLLVLWTKCSQYSAGTKPSERPVIISHHYDPLETGVQLVHIWSRASGLTWVHTSTTLQSEMTCERSGSHFEFSLWLWTKVLCQVLLEAGKMKIPQYRPVLRLVEDKRKNPMAVVGLGHSSAGRSEAALPLLCLKWRISSQIIRHQHM